MNHKVSLGCLINRKKALFLMVAILLYLFLFCLSDFGRRFIFFDIILLIILIASSVSFMFDLAWVFYDDHVEVTKKARWYQQVLGCFICLFTGKTDKLVEKISYDDILNLELVYKTVHGQGPSNIMGDNFYLKLKLKNNQSYTFDLRLIHNTNKLLNEAVTILQAHDVKIVDKGNVLDLMKNDKNLYAEFHKND